MISQKTPLAFNYSIIAYLTLAYLMIFEYALLNFLPYQVYFSFSYPGSLKYTSSFMTIAYKLSNIYSKLLVLFQVSVLSPLHVPNNERQMQPLEQRLGLKRTLLLPVVISWILGGMFGQLDSKNTSNSQAPQEQGVSEEPVISTFMKSIREVLKKAVTGGEFKGFFYQKYYWKIGAFIKILY